MQHHPTQVRFKRCFWSKSASDEKKKHFWSNQEQPRLNLVSRPLSRFTGRLAPQNYQMINIWSNLLSSDAREVVKKEEGYFTVRLTVRGLWICFGWCKRKVFFLSKNTVLSLFKWVKIFTFAYGQGPPYGQPDRKISILFWTTPLSLLLW